MGKIGGAIQRVDNPAVAVLFAGEIGLLFSKDRVVGKILPQYIYAATLDLPIYRSDQIDRAFVGDFFWLLPVFANESPGSLCCLPGSLKEFCGFWCGGVHWKSHRSFDSHSRAIGNPATSNIWIDASAAMTLTEAIYVLLSQLPKRHAT
jgi:hypothetical protein